VHLILKNSLRIGIRTPFVFEQLITFFLCDHSSFHLAFGN
jgi:hypothetical protein